MPRNVDHDERRREILEATVRVLAKRGIRGLSFRAIARELGGSTTLVTHYFGSQADLLQGVADSFAAEIEAEIVERLEAIDDPHERLLILLEWLVPATEEALLQEKARITVLADRLTGEEVDQGFELWEVRVRALLRTHLRQLVPAAEVDLRVDMLRVLTNGLTLSAVEHPEVWTRERLIVAIKKAIEDMGLDRSAAAFRG